VDLAVVHAKWWVSRGRSSRGQIAVIAAALLISGCVWLALHHAFPSRTAFGLIAPVMVFVVILWGFYTAVGVMVAAPLVAFVLMSIALFLQPVDAIGIAVVLLSFGAAVLATDRYACHREAGKTLRERQQAILDGVPAAIFLFDAAGTVRLFSATAERMFGWRSGQIIGHPVWLLFAPESQEVIKTCLASASRTGEPAGFGLPRTAVGHRRDGSMFQVELSVSPRRSVREQLFTGFCRDLSESQVAQNELKMLQNQLAHLSRLTVMGQLATSLAHELNQPLLAISNYVSASTRLIQQSPPDLVLVDDALRAAAAQTLRAGQIIIGLRGFVSKTDGRRRLQTLKPLVDEAAILAAAGGQVGWLSISISSDLPPVLVDRVQIQQVLLNLIRNGVEAMEASGSGLRMWIAARSIAGFVQVTVSDNGPGVAPDIADKLLQPFVSTKETGLGIGLSISKEIIEAHGGKMWLDLSASHGAVFKFTLPVTGADDVTVSD
jgi:two-component system sensor kinase FixL